METTRKENLASSSRQVSSSGLGCRRRLADVDTHSTSSGTPPTYETSTSTLLSTPAPSCPSPLTTSIRSPHPLYQTHSRCRRLHPKSKIRRNQTRKRDSKKRGTRATSTTPHRHTPTRIKTQNINIDKKMTPILMQTRMKAHTRLQPHTPHAPGPLMLMAVAFHHFCSHKTSTSQPATSQS